ncbi:MAG: ABC transporter ATP-binding protein [Patescibacteria group bacterium]
MIINTSSSVKVLDNNPILEAEIQTTKDYIISCKDLVKKYKNGKNITTALGPVSFEVEKGEFFGIYGRSGSGKSTLMNILTSLDKASSGELKINQRLVTKLSGKSLREFRGSIGIIFQSYNLLPNLNVMDNILVASWSSNRIVNKEYAKELLNKLGIEKLEFKNIKTLSGGEKQRVAIARALINKPSILFCDEPTGALDYNNEKQVIEILKELNSEGITVVMITHNSELERFFDRFITLNDGQIINQN